MTLAPESLTHAPALQIVIPLMAAPLAVLVRRGALAWAVAWLAALGTLACSVALLTQVVSTGPVRYFMGSWPPPWGIEYRVDLANALLLALVSAVGSIVLTFSRLSAEEELGPDRLHLFYGMFLLCLTGLLGVRSGSISEAPAGCLKEAP